MIRILAILFALTTCAFAQVKQSGNVTPGHAACWTTNGVVQDCGTAAIPYLTTLGTWGQGPTFCSLTALPASGAWQSICLGGTTSGGAEIYVQNYGSAPAQALTLNLNGTLYQFPFSGSGAGNVVGPNTSTVNDLACWNNGLGTLLKDCGISGTAVFSKIKVTTYCASGCTSSSTTYTPTANMVYVTFEGVGGGGGGGNAVGSASAGDFFAGGSGAPGGYSKVTVSAATVGASQALTFGTAGAGGSGAAAANGTAGGATSVGSILVANGGGGGGGTSLSTFGSGGAPATAGTGDIAAAGFMGSSGVYLGYGTSPNTADAAANSGLGIPGFGAGGQPPTGNSSCSAGANGTGHGSSGTGAACQNSSSNANGGNGTPGMIVVTEILNQ